MGRYGAYAPHTVEYQIYRGEATDSSADRIQLYLYKQKRARTTLDQSTIGTVGSDAAMCDSR